MAGIVRELLRRGFRDGDGPGRPLSLEEVLVVAPLNAHVPRPAAAQPPGARVGAVDRFPGREAPLVVYAPATSGAGPHGTVVPLEASTG